jgi:hypothetical protein
MNGFYSVFKPGGKKIADCGSLQDATTLVAMKGDGHYYQFTPYPGDIIDVSFGKQLPTRDIVVNMDGGVGGSWEEIYEQFDEAFSAKKQKQLNQDDAEVFVP